MSPNGSDNRKRKISSPSNVSFLGFRPTKPKSTTTTLSVLPISLDLYNPFHKNVHDAELGYENRTTNNDASCSPAEKGTKENLDLTSSDPSMPSTSGYNMELDEEMLEDPGTNGDTVAVSRTRNDECSEACEGPCPICKEVISTRREMTEHLKNHHGKGEKVCLACDKKLSSRSSLERHLLTHSGEKPYQCPRCEDKFTTNGNVHRHLKLHTENEKTRRRENKETKENLPGGETLNEVVGPSRENVESHQEEDESAEKEVAPDAMEVIANNMATGSPNGTESLEMDTPKPKRPKRKVCSRGGPQDKRARSEVPKSPKKPIKSKTNPKKKGGPPPPLVFSLPFSSTKFPLLTSSKEAQDTMPRKNTPVYKCSKCIEVFLDLESLHNHAHEDPSSPDSDFFCPVCRVTHSSFCEFASHRMQGYYQPEESCSQSRFLKQFGLYGNPDSRQDSPGVVSRDSGVATSDSDVVSPDSGVVSPDSGVVSPDSGVVSPDSGVVSPDLPLEDTTEDTSNDFADIKSILSNVSVSAEQTKVERVSRCSKKGRHNCKECEYSSPDKSGITRHMPVHTKEQNYKCVFQSEKDSEPCGTLFTIKANGERHARRKHRLPKDKVKSVIQCEKPGEKAQCPYCEKEFLDTESKNNHLRSNACPKKPFRCRKCGQGFKTNNNYNRHFKKICGKGLSGETLKRERVKNCLKFKKKEKPAQNGSSSTRIPRTERAVASTSNSRNAEAAYAGRSSSSSDGERMEYDSGVGMEEPLDLSLHALDLRPSAARQSNLPSTSTPLDLLRRSYMSAAATLRPIRPLEDIQRQLERHLQAVMGRGVLQDSDENVRLQEGADLASVRSVINTANSPLLHQMMTVADPAKTNSRPKKAAKENKRFVCPRCRERFSTKSSLQRHDRKNHASDLESPPDSSSERRGSSQE